MGKISNTMNYYFSDSKRFADLFNAVFFQGESVVDPEVLSEGAEVYHQPGAEKPKTGRNGERSGIPTSGQGHTGGNDGTVENACCMGEEGKIYEKK